MPAIISGIVFNDLNHNGIFTAGEPGIPNVFVVLEDTTGNCTNVQTDSSGNYSFTNITVAGTYTVYETVVTPDACPPTQFTQPSGFNDSTTPRKIDVTVTTTQINNSTTISGNNFGHDDLTAFGCQSFAWQVAVPSGGNTSRLNRIDLATGSTVNTGNVPAGNSINSIGYNAADGNLYGWNSTTSRVCRITPDRTLLDFQAIPNLAASNCGDVNSDGYLFTYGGLTTTYFVVDVDPNRSTFLKLVDPTNGYQEKTAAPWGTNIVALNIGDWSFNPLDGQLYLIDNANLIVRRVDPTTGIVTNLTTTGVSLTGASFGGTFFDNHNNLYGLDNNSGGIFKFVISGNSAVASLQSTGQVSSANDGARCPTAPINFAALSTTKSATREVGVGDTITYTIVMNNQGNTTASNVILIDTIPSGAVFDLGTVRVDGTTISGDPNPPSGVNLGSLGVGIHTITFTATATTIPTPNPTINVGSGNFQFVDGTYPDIFTDGFNTNAASTTVNFAIVQSTKSVDQQFTTLGYTLTYTVVLKNTGIVTASNIVFIDTIPSSTTFVTNSLKQGTVTVTGSPNPPGVTLPQSIAPNGVSTITFKTLVSTIPTINPIPNDASATFTYTGNPDIPTTKNSNSNSNTVFVQFNQANLGGITKSVDKAFATCGDVIQYTINVPNSGNVTALNVVIKDTIPNGTSFVSGSVVVDNNPASTANPLTGITVPNIVPGGSSTITFQVVVNC